METKQIRKNSRKFICPIFRHNWKKVDSTNLGFRIKDVCIRCGKVRTITGKELYIE